jgi:hypothetical protein
MKKLLTVLCGVVIALSMFVTTGNTVQAEESHEGGCGCIVEPVFGAEKNKIIAALISSPEFKNAKLSVKSDGYTWRGAKNIEVVVNITYGGMIMVGVPYLNNNGTVEIAAFFDGVYMGIGPM